MLLVEGDGKALFKHFGIAVPQGVVVFSLSASPALPGEGPWVVKAQIPVGGRGKAGGIAFCRTAEETVAAVQRTLGRTIGRHLVQACLIEQAVQGEEAYLSIMIDAASGGIRVMYSDRGGIDIEQTAAGAGSLFTERCDASPAGVEAAFVRLAEKLSEHRRASLLKLGAKLGNLYFARELLLAEINPLFWSGSELVAGDAKVAIDLNALYRQPELRTLIAGRPEFYADAHRKLREGFDFIDIDPNGSIGLVTTGAGLSMMLIDEMVARGASPANFCDVRTGQLRGEPDRIIRILQWLSASPSLRVVLVNIFAGITDLAEFADLLLQALQRCPELRVPLVVRIVGNGENAARKLLAERRPDISVYTDMDEALSQTIALARG